MKKKLIATAIGAGIVAASVLVPQAAQAAEYSCAGNYRVKTTSVATGAGIIEHWYDGTNPLGSYEWHQHWDTGKGTHVSYSGMQKGSILMRATNSLVIKSKASTCYN